MIIKKLEYDWTVGGILLQVFIDTMYENALDTDNDEENVQVSSLADTTTMTELLMLKTT